jgi:hypothetical protein
MVSKDKTFPNEVKRNLNLKLNLMPKLAITVTLQKKM